MNTNLILINGDIVDRKEGLIEYCDRGHQFGDGVFEIVPVYNGKVFGMIPHMENLFTSVTRLKIPAVYMVEELVEFHEALIKATGMENGEIYMESAACPDQICVEHGPLRPGGTPIVCLPNRLSIQWIERDAAVDAVSGGR